MIRKKRAAVDTRELDIVQPTLFMYAMSLGKIGIRGGIDEELKRI
jgi:hypothetical protein